VLPGGQPIGATGIAPSAPGGIRWPLIATNDRR
jgi:hypothetical protein